MRESSRGASDDVRMRGFAHRLTVDAALSWLDAQLMLLGIRKRDPPLRRGSRTGCQNRK